MESPSGTNLYRALLAEGFKLPDECADVQLITPTDGVIQLRYVVNVTGSDLVKIGRALARIGEAAEGAKAVIGFDSWELTEEQRADNDAGRHLYDAIMEEKDARR